MPPLVTVLETREVGTLRILALPPGHLRTHLAPTGQRIQALANTICTDNDGSQSQTTFSKLVSAVATEDQQGQQTDRKRRQHGVQPVD